MGISLEKNAIFQEDSIDLILEREAGWPEGQVNLNVAISRVDDLRDEFVWLSGQHVDLSRSSTLTLEPNLAPDIYKISSIRVVPDGTGNTIELLHQHLHFLIAPGGSDLPSKEVFMNQVDDLYLRRDDLVSSELHTPGYLLCAQPVEFVGVAFAEGAPIHTVQHMRGWSLVPYGKGMRYTDLLSAVNEFLVPTYGLEVLFDSRVAEEIARRTPTFAIVTHRLKAADAVDARKWVEHRAEDILTLLGVEKGDKPRLFAAFVATNGKVTGGFYKGNYRGNLLAPINPSELAGTMERWLPLMKKPRPRLLLRLYSDAMGETERDFQYFRLWTILEFLAKDSVQGPPIAIKHADGTPILDKQGREVTTKTTLPKVYQYLRNGGFGEHLTSQGAIPLWSILRAAYEIRNAVAHEGYFNLSQETPNDSDKAMALDQRKAPWDHLYDSLKVAVWLSVLRECAE